MLPIVLTKSIAEKLSFRSKIKLGNTRRVRCALQMFHGSLAQSGAGTTDYSTSALVHRTQNVNGFLVPEEYEGAFLTRLNSTLPIDIGSFSVVQARVTNTGAVNAIMRRRLVLPFDLPAGRVISNLRIYSPGIPTTTGQNVLVESDDNGAITGATGTIEIQANMGFLTSGGTLNQELTDTLVDTITSSENFTPIFLEDGSVSSASADGDQIYLELILEVDQTARAGGSSDIAATIATGRIASATPAQVLYVEFDIA